MPFKSGWARLSVGCLVLPLWQWGLRVCVCVHTYTQTHIQAARTWAERKLGAWNGQNLQHHSSVISIINVDMNSQFADKPKPKPPPGHGWSWSVGACLRDVNWMQFRNWRLLLACRFQGWFGWIKRKFEYGMIDWNIEVYLNEIWCSCQVNLPVFTIYFKHGNKTLD